MTVCFNHYVCFIAFFTLFFIAEGQSTQHKTLPNIYEDTKALLDGLLHHIASINNERLQLLKKFTEKGWFNTSEVPSENEFEKMIEREIYESICNDAHFKTNGSRIKSRHDFKYNEVDFFLDKLNPKKDRIRHEYEDYEITDNNGGPKTAILRKSSSCWKEAYKLCKKACKDAVSTTCNAYKCVKGMKKKLKKKCKSECKHRIYDDDSYSDDYLDDYSDDYSDYYYYY